MYTCLWVFISKAIIQSFIKVILIVHDTLGTRFTNFLAPHHHSTYIFLYSTWPYLFRPFSHFQTTSIYKSGRLKLILFYATQRYHHFCILQSKKLFYSSFELCACRHIAALSIRKWFTQCNYALTTWLLHSAWMWIPVTEWLANDVSRQHFGVNINSVRPLCTRQTYRNVEPVTQCYTAQGGWSQMRRFGSHKTCTTFLLPMILKFFLLLNLLWIATKFIKLKLLKPVVIMSSKTSILSIILK